MGDSNKVTRVRLEIYASGLKNVAGVGKGISDPYAIVTRLSSDPRDKPFVLGKTEVIKNSLSPKWTKSFELDYELGSLTRVNIGVYDEIKKAKNNKPMGSAVFEIGEVLGARGNTKAKKLRHGGTLFVRVTAAPDHTNAGTLHLCLRGVGIKNVDGLFGKSDPFVELASKVSSAGGLTWHPIYRSKHILNDLNPKWEPFSVDLGRLCGGDLDKPILVSVWDWQKNGKHKSLGNFETSVNGMVAAKANGGTGTAKSVDTSKAFVLKKKGKAFGQIVVTTATVLGDSAPRPAVASAAPAAAASVPAMDVPAFSEALNKPLPSSGTTAAVVGAALAMSNLNMSAPTAPPVPYVPSASAPPLSSLPPPMPPPPPLPKFVDYLTGGCEIEMSVAIDFTGSNGDPRKPGTLHYIHRDGQLNDYEKALTAVGSVLLRYDSDKKVSVFGFGAKYGGVIQHCFQVGNDPELDGIPATLEAYRGVFRTGLTMSGPTVFDEVINFAAAQARSKQDAMKRIGQQAYKILLILTDGAVSDVEQTKRALHAASDAPMSIVIVGIGSADFTSMQFLDDFQANGGSGRDICQFVEFNRFKHDKRALTRETLDEIPDQLVDYFTSRGIMPLPAISGSQISLAASEADEQDIDLSMDVSPEGEISLANYDGTVYDDTKYDTMADYAPSAPYQPSAPPQPYKPHAAAPAQPPQPYQPHAASPAQPYGYGGAPVAAAVAAPVFHVQVPPGVAPGTQLQVQNPATRQNMIVTIPPGVAPGGTFAVSY